MKRSIAIISEHASPLVDPGSVDSGGQNVYVANISLNLARLGYTVDIFTRRYDLIMPEIFVWKDNIRVIHVPAGPPEFVRKEKLFDYMQDFTGYMSAFIQRQVKPYDLIHANFWMSGLVASDIKTALGIPFVITFHALGKVRRQFQGKQDEFPDKRFCIEERIVREADGIIAECPQDQCDLIDLYKADPEKIRQIPCGFDPAELWPVDKAHAKKSVGSEDGEFTVLQLGRIVPRKGVDTAIRGFGCLAVNKKIKAKMVIVGGESRNLDDVQDPEIGRLRDISAREGISGKVVFAGRRGREELKYYYSAADVFISTPWYEPFGITPVESMACGTPVIGSAVGGIKYTVVDGGTGYLVSPEDHESVGNYLTEFYTKPEKLRQFGALSVKRVNEFFTWQKVGGMLACFYNDVLSKQSRLYRKTRNAGKPVNITEEDGSSLVSIAFDSAFGTLQKSRDALAKSIPAAATMIAECMEKDGKVMVCGNGGGAADAQHFAAEFVGHFMAEGRKALPVISLTSDSAFLTAWSNDVGYEKIFARQIEALGRPGDIILAISTSGRSRNLVEAFNAALGLRIGRLSLLGGHGGDLLGLSDIALVVPSHNTQRIQEVHILILHLLCELVERRMHTEMIMQDFENTSDNRWLNWVDITRTKTGA